MAMGGGDPVNVYGSLGLAQAGSNGTCCGGANTGHCTLKLAQEWRQMRSVVSETARKDADGSSESCNNDTTRSIAPLRAARGTGIYEQFPPLRVICNGQHNSYLHPCTLPIT